MSEKITRSDAEWRALLDPETYRVTRQAGTERPFSHEGFPKGPGHYVCACCGARLFDGDQKFESHCGWPSFTKPLDENTVRYLEDSTFGMTRTEVRSRAGNAHLGHVFEGDPQSPNGVRFCINSASLKFIPYEKMDAAGYGKYKKYVK